MNQTELNEISQIPAKYKPLGAWTYFGYTLLFAIPLIEFICTIVFSFNNSNINRRNFARSYFCGLVLVVILAVIAILAAGGFAAFIGKING